MLFVKNNTHDYQFICLKPFREKNAKCAILDCKSTIGCVSLIFLSGILY